MEKFSHQYDGPTRCRHGQPVNLVAFHIFWSVCWKIGSIFLQDSTNISPRLAIYTGGASYPKVTRDDGIHFCSFLASCSAFSSKVPVQCQPTHLSAVTANLTCFSLRIFLLIDPCEVSALLTAQHNRRDSIFLIMRGKFLANKTARSVCIRMLNRLSAGCKYPQLFPAQCDL